jgi:TonB family protein
MRRIHIPIVLALLLAGLACLSFVSGQEPKAPAAESLESMRGRAEKGDADVQARLGYMYHVGQGVKQDYAEAARWYRKAAFQGHAVAQFNLGLLYSKGQGVPQDYVEAHKWLNLATSHASSDIQKGYADAQEELGRKMNPQQIAEAQSRAHDLGKLLPQAVTPGSSGDTDKAIPKQTTEARRGAQDFGKPVLPSIPPDFSGGVSKAGNGVTSPTITFKVQPEYSEEALDAKLTGTVILSIEVNEKGLVQNPRVLRGLGMGLDQKAIEAVMKWRFRPGMKAGKPVTVLAQVEVNFRLGDPD